jgi:hypothetical protein
MEGEEVLACAVGVVRTRLVGVRREDLFKDLTLAHRTPAPPALPALRVLDACVREAHCASASDADAMISKQSKYANDDGNEVGVAWKCARSCGTTNALGIKTKWQARFYDFEASVKNHKSKCATSKTASALPV